MSTPGKYIWRVQWTSHAGRVPRHPIYVEAANSRRARNLAIHRLQADELTITTIRSITAIADAPVDAQVTA